MKISKKQMGLVIAALIAISFFSFNSSTFTDMGAGIVVTERTTELLAPHGGKETVIIRDYQFKYYKSALDSVVLEKKSDKMKK